MLLLALHRQYERTCANRGYKWVLTRLPGWPGGAGQRWRRGFSAVFVQAPADDLGGVDPDYRPD